MKTNVWSSFDWLLKTGPHLLQVLVSEQEHREDSYYENNITNENLLDPMSKPPESPVVSKTQDCLIISLSRKSLWKHTLLQEQLYLATASRDRNILFTNKSGELVLEHPEGQRSRKGSHSPDRVSTERCQSLFKAGRTTESRQDVTSTVSVLKSMFPIAKQNEGTVTKDRYWGPGRVFKDTGICAKNLIKGTRDIIVNI